MAKKEAYLGALRNAEKALTELKANGHTSGDEWTRRFVAAAERLLEAARRCHRLP